MRWSRCPPARALLPLLVLVGSSCHPAPHETPPARLVAATADPPANPPPGLSTAVFHLSSSGIVPQGCFAWSPRTSAAACTIGTVGTSMDHPDWKVTFLGDAAAPALDLTEGAPADQVFRASDPAAASVRAKLGATLGAGGYLELKPLLHPLTAGTPLAWGSADILWTRKRTSPGGENMAPRYTDTLAIRWAPGGPPTTIETREEAPVDAPEYAVYLVPGDRFAVVSSVAAYADEGVLAVVAAAWRCDRSAGRCK